MRGRRLDTCQALCVNDADSQYVLGSFIDFKEAFDYLECWMPGVEYLPTLLFRQNGKSQIIISVDMEVKRGCSQGLVIGPYVWNLMMDVLLRQLEARNKFSAYANGLLQLVAENSRRKLEEKVLRCKSLVIGDAVLELKYR